MAEVPVVEPVVEVPVAAGVDEGEVRERVLSVVEEQTGYPLGCWIWIWIWRLDWGSTR